MTTEKPSTTTDPSTSDLDAGVDAPPAWRRYPLLAPACGLVAGTVSGAPVWETEVLWIAALAGLLALWATTAKRSWTVPAALFCVAWVLGAARDPTLSKAELPDPDRPAAVEGRVFSHVERLDDETAGFRLLADRVEQASADSEPAARRGSLMISVRSDAAALEGVRLGQRLRLRGYVRRGAGAANGRAPSRGAWRLWLESPRFLETLDRAPPSLEPSDRLRRLISSAFDRIHGPGSALARTLVLGDRSRLPEALPRTTRATGTAHLLAVSGLHVGILGAVMLGLASPLPRGLRWAAVVAVTAVYGLVVGPTASVVRAVLMLFGWIAFLAVRRPPQGVQILAGTVALMVWVHPLFVHDLGFRLSVAATWALIGVAPALGRRWAALLPDRLPWKLFAWSVAASVAAQVATAPILWPITGLVHPWGPLVDLVAVPWLTLALVASWGSALVLVVASRLGPGTAEAVSELVGPLLDLVALPLVRVAAGEPRWTGVAVGVDEAAGIVTVGIAGAGLVAAGLALGPAWARRSKRRAQGAWILAGILALLLGIGATSTARFRDPPLRDPRLWQAVFLDVGQGDAILLRSPGRAVLVDGGGWRRGDVAGRVLVPALADLGVRRLDAVVITHGDTDHCGGLADLRSYVAVDQVWSPPGLLDGPCPAEVIGRPGSRWRPLFAGMELGGGEAGWRFEVLWPPAGERGGGNGGSLVLRATAPGRSILLTGDLEAAEERRLLARGMDLRADVLKVAHHGSKSSTTVPFLRAVAPRLAVISAGFHNRYGHPHGSVVGRLEDAGARILRTDRQGMILLHRSSAGGPWRIETPAVPVEGR